ncbi:MAG: class I SAM-dependent methyltransferase [Nitrospirota bacterium]
MQTVKKWLATKLLRALHLQASNKSNKFTIELDYPPSYDFRPRWGNTHPPHQGLTDMFNKNWDEYIKILKGVAALKPFLLSISRDFPNKDRGEPGWLGGPINAIDSALLYYFVVSKRPKTYVEVGSGVTTLFAARAKRDHDLQTRIVSIDPEPRTEVDTVCDEVIKASLETTDLSIFPKLEQGDIVFMDSSHRSFMNSDVTVFMLDVIPLLKPGVIIHFHDIHLPYDYPEMFVEWYWNEQYILAAYLLGAGDKVKILMPSRFVSYTQELKTCIAPILQDWKGPSDIWLEGGSIWFTHRLEMRPK